ncbi:sensor histidine kinase [Catalinimonas niigatensis]|uniref:sensor histidine kinase n=1 Tax=Catalinimonas niigatensis TaxID=1397264 RepID=UPI002665A8E0|nr:hybrid sensor histidine kinase/response regulator [Catalinimonas niigatensis]WPP50030.1 hybrid sensor histidine kinase/response regulator [Catalinimonas niigatensis]
MMNKISERKSFFGETASLMQDPDIKILLVDDREDNLMSIEAILEKENYVFRKASSGKEALKVLLKEQDFSLILMDVEMPGLGGFETATMIYERDKLRHIPIIFITAHDSNLENIYRGYKMGAVDYISKPIDQEMLKARVSVFIELYKKNVQLKAQEQKLIAINNELEHKVQERTDELTRKNLELEAKNLELERINNDLDNFIYTASHDLKAPMANLEALVNVLNTKLEGKLEDKEEKLFNMIGMSIDKFNNTIKDLTRITMVQKELEDHKEQINFQELVADIKIDIAHLVNESGVTFFEYYDVGEIVYARKNLRSILHNLITNAIKYRSPERKAEVKIQTYCRHQAIVLSVSDNGLGLSEEHQAKMFSMFKRFHSHVEGSGIGLYIIKKIVENNGGKIEMESEKGKGTTFKVIFDQQVQTDENNPSEQAKK